MYGTNALEKPFLFGYLSKPNSLGKGSAEDFKLQPAIYKLYRCEKLGDDLIEMSVQMKEGLRYEMFMNVRGFGIGNIFLDNFSCAEQMLLLNASEVLVLLPSKRESLPLKEHSGFGTFHQWFPKVAPHFWWKHPDILGSSSGQSF